MQRILAEVDNPLDVTEKDDSEAKLGLLDWECAYIWTTTAVVKYKRQRILERRGDIELSFRYLSAPGTSWMRYSLNTWLKVSAIWEEVTAKARAVFNCWNLFSYWNHEHDWDHIWFLPPQVSFLKDMELSPCNL